MSGITDIYEVFSELINKLQIVCSLPHERYDQAMSIVSKFTQMKDTMIISDCSCNDVNNYDTCLWPNFHRDVKSVGSSGATFRSVPIGMVGPEELNTRHGSRLNDEQAGQNVEYSIQLCIDRLSGVLSYIVKHLTEEVFDGKDRKTIENVRTLLSLTKLHDQCSVSGFNHVANVTFPYFLQSSL